MQQSINANTQYSDLDGNNDGRLSSKELSEACNITLEEAQQCIEQYDADGDGLLDYEEFNNLKEQILEQQREFMTNEINHDDNHENFDADNDGKLSAKELSQACNISIEDAQNIILQYDVDGDGMLDAEEFENLKQQILKQQRENMTNVISANDEHNNFDVNNDGKLSAKELANACNITQIEAENIIKQYDVNNDGMLDAEEFEQLKQQILKQQREKLANTNLNNIDDIDDNKDGKISAYELSQSCNITLKEAELLIQQNDNDGDGMLDAEEFEQLKNKILQEQQEKERLKNLQKERQQRQQQQQQQYNGNNDNDESTKFKHKWKLGMNFDPKNEEIIIYVSDEITKKNWGITLTSSNFINGGNIRQEYRKIGDCVSNGQITYNYPENGGPLNIMIQKENNKYNYSCPQQ